MGSRNSLLDVTLAAAAIVTLGSCTGDSDEFPLQPLACQLAPPSEVVAAPTLSDSDIKMALDDIATRILPTFAAGRERDALSEHITKLSTSLSAAPPVAKCLAIQSAREMLDAIAPTPETDPDRALVELTLEVVSESIRQRLEAN